MKCLLLIATLLIPELVHSQSTDNIDYGKRARSKTIAGGVLLGGGIIAVISGVAATAKEDAESTYTGNGLKIMGVGLVSSVVGIGLLISSRKDRKKAASISAGYLNYPLNPRGITSFKSVPSVTLRIKF